MHRESGGETFLEALAPARLGRNAQLERIAALVDWAPLAEIVAVVYAAPRGRPAYPPLLMVKALLRVVQPLGRGVGGGALGPHFRRRLGLDADAPDRATVTGVGAAPGPAARRAQPQLEARRLVVKQGALMDATVVEAQVRRPGGGRAGASAAPATRTPVGRARGRAYFGYQDLGVDQGSGPPGQLHPAHVNGRIDALIVGDERAVYAISIRTAGGGCARLASRTGLSTGAQAPAPPAPLAAAP